jgi:TonB family protein
MFDYAISQYERRRISKRTLSALIASFLIHLLGIIILINNPSLLQGGKLYQFRAMPLIQYIYSLRFQEDKEDDWRMVTLLKKSEPMTAPSIATIKKYLNDLNRKGPGAGLSTVRISLANEQNAATATPTPKTNQEMKDPRPTSLAQEAAGTTQNPSDTATNTPGSETDAQKNLSASEKGSINNLVPGKEGTNTAKTETAGNTAPRSIPNSIQPEASIPKSIDNSARVFENEKKAIQSEGSGLFGTKGFPLGDYVRIITERIKGNWYIPSNIKNTQGRTTVIFYIDKNGRFTDARIVNRSGSNSLDLAALNAVLESDPFPPLPKGFPGDHVGAKFVFSYNESQ